MAQQNLDLLDLMASTREGTVDPELREYLTGYVVNMFKLDMEAPVGDWWAVPIPPQFNQQHRLQFRRTGEQTFEIRVVPTP